MEDCVCKTTAEDRTAKAGIMVMMMMNWRGEYKRKIGWGKFETAGGGENNRKRMKGERKVRYEVQKIRKVCKTNLRF